jgi:hypothetical protein
VATDWAVGAFETLTSVRMVGWRNFAALLTVKTSKMSMSSIRLDTATLDVEQAIWNVPESGLNSGLA